MSVVFTGIERFIIGLSCPPRAFQEPILILGAHYCLSNLAGLEEKKENVRDIVRLYSHNGRAVALALLLSYPDHRDQ